MISRLAPLLPLLLVLACAPAPPSAQPPPATATPSAAPAPDAPPSASVTAVEPSKESASYVRAKIVFSNPGKRPCTVSGYKVSWGSSSKAIKLQSLTVPPGETRERWLKVAPDDGDLGGLTPAAARVEIQAECGGS